MSDQLIVEWPRDRVCVLRLNRPDAFNALSRALTEALRAAVRGLSATSAQVMILAGTGRGFCAGADLKERLIMTDAEKFAHNRAISALADDIAALPMATVAAINGIAMGGGMEISLACDLRFAANGVRLGLTEARVGAIPGAGGSQRLPRLIGTSRALELMYSGEPIAAEHAQAWGLVNDVVPAEALMERALSFAAIVSTRSRRAGALLKDAVYRGIDRPLSEGLAIEAEAVAEILHSDDYKEGLAAFSERRQPVFGR
ncbi:MAG: enoyl-CoA hydratase/isomerase family protein [Rhodobacteraceae bacterium]|nr:enoyl-CoA hydratase/isomerase family protein [Paracoccaceae bacterium]